MLSRRKGIVPYVVPHDGGCREVKGKCGSPSRRKTGRSCQVQLLRRGLGVDPVDGPHSPCQAVLERAEPSTSRAHLQRDGDISAFATVQQKSSTRTRRSSWPPTKSTLEARHTRHKLLWRSLRIRRNIYPTVPPSTIFLFQPHKMRRPDRTRRHLLAHWSQTVPEAVCRRRADGRMFVRYFSATPRRSTHRCRRCWVGGAARRRRALRRRPAVRGA